MPTVVEVLTAFTSVNVAVHVFPPTTTGESRAGNLSGYHTFPDDSVLLFRAAESRFSWPEDSLGRTVPDFSVSLENAHARLTPSSRMPESDHAALTVGSGLGHSRVAPRKPTLHASSPVLCR